MPVRLEQVVEPLPFLLAAGKQGLEAEPDLARVASVDAGEELEGCRRLGRTDREVVQAKVGHEPRYAGGQRLRIHLPRGRCGGVVHSRSLRWPPGATRRLGP